MMLVHSAFRPLSENFDLQLRHLQHDGYNEPLGRYAAYQAACVKYSAEIKAIQKFIPGWMPEPPSK